MNLARSFGLMAAVIFLAACNADRWEKPTDHIKYDAKILRLDKDIFSIDPQEAHAQLVALIPVYGNFLDEYTNQIMQVGPADNPMTGALLMRFTTDADWKQLQRDIESRFDEMGVYEAGFTRAFRRYAAHFGEEGLPQIVAYNSGFNVGIYPTETHLGIGLEWYAGSDLKIVGMLPPEIFPQYKRDKMLPEYLVVNALKGWLMVQHQHRLEKDDLLSQMVFSGKVLFVLSALLPEAEPWHLLNYSKEQWDWCKSSEFDIWKFLLEKDAIFTTDHLDIGKLMNDGPFTPGMPAESPGGVGNWVGFRMVQAYMQVHQETSLRQLMEISDEKKILKTYKPGK